jgi:hypothetical protein
MPYNFDAMDGGERAPNNLLGFYGAQGLSNTDPSIGIGLESTTGKYFFSCGTSLRNWVWYPLKGTLAILTNFWGVLFKFVGGASDVQSINFCTASGKNQLTVQFNLNGSLSLLSGGEVLATSAAGTVYAGMIAFLDVLFNVSASASTIVVRLNGQAVPALSLTGQNTEFDTTTPAVTYVSCAISAGGLALRDFYVHDGTGPAPFNALIGPSGCVALTVASQVSAAFTPEGGATNLANASQIPPNPLVDYNAGSTVGQADRYGIEALPSNVLEVIALSPWDYSYRTDTAGTRALQKTLILGTESVVGTENYLNASPTLNQDPWIVTDVTTGNTLYSEGTGAITVVNGANLEYAVAA